MSASGVRSQTRTWCREVAVTTGFPFIDTVNEQNRPKDEIWWSVEFEAINSEGTFCDTGYIENGFIRFVVFGLPGVGDLQAIQALEAIIIEVMKKKDATNKLSLTAYSPVNDYSAGSADNFYQVECSIDYAFSN